MTQELWQAVVGENNWRFPNPKHPAERISWLDCQTFLHRINESISGLNLQLPSEAQWEYACRAGNENTRYGELEQIAWYRANSARTTHPVKEKAPNKFGLYDMLGNVWEWCRDASFRKYESKPLIVDPEIVADDENASRVIRGGSWHDSAASVRAAYRSNWHPGSRRNNVGFRCLSSPEPSK